jgi:hypothetical protein
MNFMDYRKVNYYSTALFSKSCRVEFKDLTSILVRLCMIHGSSVDGQNDALSDGFEPDNVSKMP